MDIRTYTVIREELQRAGVTIPCKPIANGIEDGLSVHSIAKVMQEYTDDETLERLASIVEHICHRLETQS